MLKDYYVKNIIVKTISRDFFETEKWKKEIKKRKKKNGKLKKMNEKEVKWALFNSKYYKKKSIIFIIWCYRM